MVVVVGLEDPDRQKKTPETRVADNRPHRPGTGSSFQRISFFHGGYQRKHAGGAMKTFKEKKRGSTWDVHTGVHLPKGKVSKKATKRSMVRKGIR